MEAARFSGHIGTEKVIRAAREGMAEPAEVPQQAAAPAAEPSAPPRP